MSVNIKLLSEKYSDKWQDYVNNSECGTVYHTLEWKRVIEKEFNFKPQYLLAIKDENVKGVFPIFQTKTFFKKKFISQPFSYLGGPIADSQEITSELLNHGFMLADKSKAAYFEVRGGLGQGLDNSMEVSSYYRDFELELQKNPEEVFEGIHKKSIGRYIKKSNEIEITKATTDEAINEFYDLYLLMRKRHGVPPQSSSFFKIMFEELKNKGYIKTLIAKQGDENLAAIVLLLFRDKIIYAYGASDEKYKKLHPNIRLLWEGIKYGCENDYRYFYFGRTSPDQKGLLEFKRRWGGKEYPLDYYFYPTSPKSSAMNRKSFTYRVSTTAWRGLPTSLSKRLGSRIINNFP